MSTKPADGRVQLGRRAEDFAAEYLAKTLGWDVRARNWRCPVGEIDIAALDGDTLVVVEVRARQSQRFGPAEAAVDVRKARRILRVTPWLLQDPRIPSAAAVRFDVITVACEHGSIVRMAHVRNAFEGCI